VAPCVWIASADRSDRDQLSIEHMEYGKSIEKVFGHHAPTQYTNAKDKSRRLKVLILNMHAFRKS